MSMIRRKGSDCCCNDWKDKLNQLWEQYHTTIHKIKARGTVVYPDGDGVADITSLVETVTVDDALNTTSINPVQNRVIANAIDGIEADVDALEVSVEGLSEVARTGDYDDLLNKPTIPAAQVNSDWDAVSGVAQILNKPTLATVATTGSYEDLSDKPIIPPGSVLYPGTGQNVDGAITQKGTTDALALKQDMLTFDTTPTQNSANPVTSGGIKTALDGKEDVLTFDTTPISGSNNPVTSGGIKAALDGKEDALTFDTTPTQNSTNPVTSGGIKTALDGKEDVLTFDTTPTQNSTNPVTSGGVYTALQNISSLTGNDYTTAREIWNAIESFLHTGMWDYSLPLVMTIMVSVSYSGDYYYYNAIPSYNGSTIKLTFIDWSNTIRVIQVGSSTITMPSGFTLNHVSIWYLTQ